MQSFSQCCCTSRVNDKKRVITLAVKDSPHEGTGAELRFRFQDSNRPTYSNPYFGIEVNEKSAGGQIGLRHNLIPYARNECFKFQFITAIAYLYRVDVIVGGETRHIVYDAFESQREMLAGFRFGPTIQYRRLSLWITGNPMLSWDSRAPLVWKKNLYYLISGEVGIGFDLTVGKK